ncbi:MAG: hypothetical protein LBU81_00805 [Methanosarcinales archaeon]|nr:hypothetical protein [Methanosarcinales archaeon]
MQYTEKLHLKKPDRSDSYKVADFNENTDILDTAAGQLITDVEDIKTELDDGIMLKEINAAAVSTMMVGTDVIPKVSADGILQKIEWIDMMLPYKSHSKSVNTMIASMNEEISRLWLSEAARGEIVSTGNDNLEYFGIRQQGQLNALNNYSDFGVLAEPVEAGENQIKIINASGYRFVERKVDGNLSNYTLLTLPNYYPAFVSDSGKINMVVRSNNNFEQYTNCSYKTITEEGFVINTIGQSVGFFSTVPRLVIKNLGIILAPQSSSAPWRDLIFYNENGNQISRSGTLDLYDGYSIVFDSFNRVFLLSTFRSTPHLYYQSQKIINNTSPIVFTSGAHRIEVGGIQLYSLDSEVYILNSGTDSIIITSNYTATTKKTVTGSPVNLAHNGSSFLILMSDGNLYRFNSISDKLDVNDNGTLITIPFLNSRTVLSINAQKGIFYLCGTESLLGYSNDGLAWVEILSNDDNEINMNYENVCASNNYIYLCSKNATNAGFSKFESFAPEKFKNKRYKLDSEFVTVTDVSIVNDDIILTLQNDLLQSHTSGALMLRTTDSTIQPNSVQTVCVDLQNHYSHDEIAGIPTFTSLDNTTVIAEVCGRDSEDEVEEWVPMTLVTEIDSNGWKKQKWAHKFDSEKRIFSIAFTVDHENDQAIELNNLVGAVADSLE